MRWRAINVVLVEVMVGLILMIFVMMMLKASIGCAFPYFVFILSFGWWENYNMHLDTMNFSKQYDISHDVEYNT